MKRKILVALACSAALALTGCNNVGPATPLSPTIQADITAACSWAPLAATALEIAVPLVASSIAAPAELGLQTIQSICANPPANATGIVVTVATAISNVETALAAAKPKLGAGSQKATVSLAITKLHAVKMKLHVAH
jgi:hypothetical protein